MTATALSLPELSTREEVAALLRVHVSTVDKLVREGELPALKFGAVVRFSRVALERFMARQTTEPCTPRTRKSARGAGLAP